MRTRIGLPTRPSRRPRLTTLSHDPRHARLARYSDPVGAEDDYFRFANRNR